ncbi:MAG: zinc ribbon domain-containing protein [Myxococcales bacterium]|nr:zinc ribbon domain-containing protein [Myxococcales bacterium]
MTQTPEPRSDTVSSLQFPCKACGAKMVFHPGQTALRCAHCDYTEDIPKSSEEVREHSFDDTPPKSAMTGYGVDHRRLECKQCGATTEVEPHIVAYRCAFCASNHVVPQEQSLAVLRPESVLPFRFERERCLDVFRLWLNRLWFRPNTLKKLAQSGDIQGVYLPFWTYDTLTQSYWTAEAGYHYYETVTSRDSNGKQVTRQVQRTRWEPVSGDHTEFFDDVLVQASPSADPSIVRRLEPYPTKELLPYKPDYLSGFLAEDYRSDMVECWPVAKDRIDSAIRAACARKVPGDTQRNLRVNTGYYNRTYKLCLLPVWIAAYLYNGKSYVYMVNGVTGKVEGQAPLSWIKVISFVVVLLAAVGIMAYFLR